MFQWLSQKYDVQLATTYSIQLKHSARKQHALCVTSVTVSDKNIIGDIKKQITDLSDKIGKEVKKVITGKTKEKAILEINGKKYDKELINLVIELSEDKKEIDLKNTKKYLQRSMIIMNIRH